MENGLGGSFLAIDLGENACNYGYKKEYKVCLRVSQEELVP